MRPASEQLLDAVRGSHQVTSRARVCTRYQTGVDPDGEEIEVLSGDVTSDSTAEIRSTLDMTTEGSTWTPEPSGLLTPYGNEVFAEAGVLLGGGVEWVPLGYYRLAAVDEDGDGGPLRLAGQDRMAGIRDSKLLTMVQFGAKATVAEVFDRLVHEVYPDAHIVFDWPAGNDELGRALIAAGEEEDTDNDRYAFLADLATSRGKDMYFDHAGVLRVASPPDPLHPAAEIDSGPDGVLVQASRSLTREGVFNAVVAEGEGADDKDPVRAVVKDLDPNSPTYWLGPFGQVPKFYSSPKLPLDTVARRAASRILGQTRGLPYNLDLSAVPNPALEAGDPILVTHRDGTQERHRLERVPTGLTAEDSWTASTRQQSLAALGGCVMPDSDDLVPLLLQARQSLGMRQGKVLSWDSSTGTNEVSVGGAVLEDLPVLAATGTVLLAPGDVVALLRFKSTYFVLGRIGVAGEGALAIRAASVTADETTTSATFTDLPTPGPTLTDVYIGSTRRCLVFMSVEISIGDGAGAHASFEVTGASSIAPEGEQSVLYGGNSAMAQSVASMIVLTAADGLNEGLNTFHMLYERYTGTTDVHFRSRRLMVMPF